MLITAGPTHEPIDAVRYLANRSSGRMGIALAEAAVTHPHTVTLLLGPTHIQPPNSSQIHTIRFQTTADLQALLAEHWANHDVLIMAAAVADFRPARVDLTVKKRREERGLRLDLEATPDLLAEVAASRRPEQTIIGFALEPQTQLLASAWEKLQRKGADAIIANPLRTIDSETVSAVVVLRTGQTMRPPADCSKREFADWLLRRLPEITAAAAAERV